MSDKPTPPPPGYERTRSWPFDAIDLTIACDGITVRETVELARGENPQRAAERFFADGGFPLESKVEWSALAKRGAN